VAEKDKINEILYILRGSKIKSKRKRVNNKRVSTIELYDMKELVKENADLVARCILYSLKNKNYHREQLMRAIICLINYGTTYYRGVGWSLIQKIPLSYLLYLTNKRVMKPRENKRQLRHAICVKLAKSSKREILRTFLMSPNLFRAIFKLYIPRTKIHDKEITNESYKLAYHLAQSKTEDIFVEFNIKVKDLIKDYKIPFERLMNLIKSPEDAKELIEYISSKNFFEHGRWFRNIIGDDEYNKIALEKIEDLENPFQFLANRSHLKQTGVLTQELIDFLEDKANNVLEEMFIKANLKNLILIVDISGSMDAAKELTSKLYEVLSNLGKKKQSKINMKIIAFNNTAMQLKPKELKEINPNGSTSIGSSIVKVDKILKNLDENSYPQALIIISDWEENTSPYISDPAVLSLLKKYGLPPIIALHVGSYSYNRLKSLNNLKYYIDEKEEITKIYPHAVISVKEFYPALVVSILQEIIRLTSKVVVEEKDLTKTIKVRKPIEEELGDIKVPERPKETYKKGYLEKLLCEN